MNLSKKIIAAVLAALMAFSVMPLTAFAQTNDINFNLDNAKVRWYDYSSSQGYWYLQAVSDDFYTTINLQSKNNISQAAGTYTADDLDATQSYYYNPFDNNGKDVNFTEGSCTLEVNGYIVTFNGSFKGSDGNTYNISITNTFGPDVSTTYTAGQSVTFDDLNIGDRLESGVNITNIPGGIYIDNNYVDGVSSTYTTADGLTLVKKGTGWPNFALYFVSDTTANSLSEVTFVRASKAAELEHVGSCSKEQAYAWIMLNYKQLCGERMEADALDYSVSAWLYSCYVDEESNSETVDAINVDNNVALEMFSSFDVPKTYTEENGVVYYVASSSIPAVEPNNGVNITVADTISENFYLDDEYYGETSYITASYNHASNISETPNVDTDIVAMSSLNEKADGDYAGNRIFSVVQAPAQSTETITINFYATAEDAANGTNAIGEPIEYSIYKYCREIITSFTGAKETEMKNLAKATLDYAASAQYYFNYNTDKMATVDNTGNAFYGDVNSVTFDGVAGVNSLANGIEAFTTVVKSDLEINLLSRTPINVTSASIHTTGTSRFAAQSTTNGDWYVVHISGIEPANMDNTFTVVTDKGNIVMSANAIMKLMANSNDAKMVTLAKAMYLYGQAANAYFD
jgi:hypothetical protein